MKRAECSTACYAAVAIALVCRSTFAPAWMAVPQEQKARKPDGEPSGKRGAYADVDLAELQTPPSEMRGLIERFQADRNSLNHSSTVAASPAHDARLRQFLTDWRTNLETLNFDTMSQDGR